MRSAGKLLARALSLLPLDSLATPELLRKLDDALFEVGDHTNRGFRAASFRCFWHWPLGHRWEFKMSADRPMLRCAACGKAKGAPRSRVFVRGAPADTHLRIDPGSGG